MTETRRRLRDEIELAARKQKIVRSNVALVKNDIHTFLTAVQSKCNELCLEADENGDILQALVNSKLDILQKREETLGADINDLKKLLEVPTRPAIDAETFTKKIKSYEEGNARIVKTLLDKERSSDLVKMEFFAPCDGRIEDELVLHIHPESEGERGDSGLYILPNCCDSQRQHKKQPVAKARKAETPPDTDPKSDQDINPPSQTRDSVKPEVPPRPAGKVVMRQRESYENTTLKPQLKLVTHTDFYKYLDKILHHDGSIENHYSCFLSIIFDQIWIIAKSEIHVYSSDKNEITTMKIESVSKGKLGTYPTACVQNNKGIVFMTFNRPSYTSRETALNGIWTLNPTNGNVEDKLTGSKDGGYVNIACDENTVVGLRASLSQVSIHTKVGEDADDWIPTVLQLITPTDDATLLAHKGLVYVVDKTDYIAITSNGRVVQRNKFPDIDDTELECRLVWHLCAFDSNDRMIVCEQSSGRVFLREADGKYTRIEFGEVGSDLEFPTQAMADFDGNLWIHEQTVYGDMVSKFLAT